MQICYHHLYFVDRIAILSIQNMLPAPATSQVLEELTAVAMGRRPAERIVENARLVNVHSQEILEGSVAITSGRIAAVGEVHGSGPDTEVIDAQGAYVLPGYVEPHAHPWMIATPDSYGEYALRRGTTTIAGEMLNMQAETTPTGMRRIHDDLQRMPIRWFWTVRATGQSGEELEEIFPWADWEDYLAHEDVAVLGEVTGWPQALAGDPELLRRIAAARRRGLAVDAHSAGAGPKRIPGLAAAGFTSDHEAITVEEARAALRAGLNVQLRHSSLRPDIETLLPLIQETDAWHRLAITTDGAAPAWSGRYGLADGIVKILIEHGIPIPKAVALATLNPATQIGKGRDLGGLAPGFAADLQIVRDFDGQPPELVMVGGRTVSVRGELVVDPCRVDWGAHPIAPLRVPASVLADPASYRPRSAPRATVPLMRFVSPAVTKAEEAVTDDRGVVPGAALMVHFSRDGRLRAEGWTRGFGERIEGMASTFTTSRGIVVFGTDPAAMAQAAARVAETRGGIAISRGGRITASMALDVGWTTSAKPLEELQRETEEIWAEAVRGGYEYQELAFGLCFLSADFLPRLRLVNEGLLDIVTREILVPATRLDQDPGPRGDPAGRAPSLAGQPAPGPGS